MATATQSASPARDLGDAVVIDLWVFLGDFLRTALVVGAFIGLGVLINLWFTRGE